MNKLEIVACSVREEATRQLKVEFAGLSADKSHWALKDPEKFSYNPSREAINERYRQIVEGLRELYKD